VAQGAIDQPHARQRDRQVQEQQRDKHESRDDAPREQGEPRRRQQNATRRHEVDGDAERVDPVGMLGPFTIAARHRLRVGAPFPPRSSDPWEATPVNAMNAA
jgi:hypothetical protein